ncbi:MAG TPA: hypothetical protein VN442_18890 [Bryobacteraceae bacterium]|nr:hypothetical protein [Bryobacteraceae bacterium]
MIARLPQMWMARRTPMRGNVIFTTLPQHACSAHLNAVLPTQLLKAISAAIQMIFFAIAFKIAS